MACHGKEGASNNKILGDIRDKFNLHLQSFESVNSLLKTQFIELQKELEECKTTLNFSEPILMEHLDRIFLVKHLSQARETSKYMSMLFTALYKSLIDLPKTVASATSTIHNPINPNFKINLVKGDQSNNFLISMLVESAEERQKMSLAESSKEAAFEQKHASLAQKHFELCPKKTENPNMDVTGYHPNTKTIEVLKASMRKCRDQETLLFIIAELCEDYDLLIAKLTFYDFKEIGEVLFEDIKMTQTRLEAIWYFTKWMMNNSGMNKHEKNKMWAWLQDKLAKYSQ